MEEFVKKAIAMPCHKYMVRTIKSEEEKLIYARAFISKLYETGQKESDIMACYAASSSFRKNPELHFLTYQGETLSDDAFYRKILGDDSIPRYSSCRKYLKVHPKNINNICKICPFFTGYKNQNNETELAILKFVATSKANLDFFLSLSDAKYFKCCYDLAENTSSDTPFVVPLTKLCFLAIQKCGIEYFEESLLAMTDVDKLVSLQSRIISTLRSRYNIDSEFPEYISVFPTIWKIFVNDIFSTDLISKSDVKGYIEFSKIIDKVSTEKSENPYCLDSVEHEKELVSNKLGPDTNSILSTTTDQREIKSISDVTLSDEITKEISHPLPVAADDSVKYVESSYNNVSDNFSLESLKIEDSRNQDIVNDKDIFEENNSDAHNLFRPQEDIVKESSAYDTLLNLHEPDAEFAKSEHKKNEMLPPFQEQIATSSQQIEEVANIPQMENYCDANSYNQTNAKKQNVAKSEYDNSMAATDAITLLPIKINDIPIPTISYENIQHTCILVSDENADLIAISAVKEHMISLECIQDENNAYILLFWDAFSLKFYYTYFSSLHSRVKEILAFKSIRKICYQPYYLYSLSKIYEVPVRNVFSIYSAHIICTGFSISMTYRDIVELYTSGYQFEQKVENISIKSDFMGGLPFYAKIFHNLNHIVKSVPLLEDKITSMFLVDEAIGISFLRSLNFVEDDLLFHFQEDGSIHYNDNHVKQVKRDGALVTYVIENNTFSRQDRQKIYLEILKELVRAGRFRKLNIQLVTLTGDIMMLFIGSDAFELLDTSIKVLFSKFATDHHIDSFHILTSREWLMAEHDNIPLRVEEYAAEEDNDL